MEKKRTQKLLLLIFSVIYLAGSAQTKNISFGAPHKIWNKKFRTLLVRSNDNLVSGPIIDLNSGNFVQIRFDYLGQESMNLGYRILHCNNQWEESGLLSNEYIDGFEDNPISDYSYSLGTKIPFTHFTFRFPSFDAKPIISGNFKIQIFDYSDPETVLLEAGVLVFDGKVGISGRVSGTNKVQLRESHQELILDISSGLIGPIIQPTDYKIIVLQNWRWDNGVVLDPPRFYDRTNMLYNTPGGIIFEGGNEFRSFDFRNLNIANAGIYKTDTRSDTSRLETVLQLNRRIRPYINSDDLNGFFIIENEMGFNRHLEADYFWLDHYVESEIPYGAGFVSLTGADIEQLPQKEKELLFDPTNHWYHGRSLLKMGFYSWQYGVRRNPSDAKKLNFLEGSFYQTENTYQVLVYYKAFSSDFEELVGFFPLTSQ
ncbi:MAG: hypothetical protein ACJAY8_000276 [Sphingobacteriales bacterium]|jgi:hypothetical protein